jgi:hypothetical protein
MFLRRIAPLLFAVGLALVLAACDEPPGKSASPSRSGTPIDPEAYGAMPRALPAVSVVRVDNEFGGDIIITAHELPQAKEVALDYTAFSTGPDPVLAAAEARRAVDVRLDYDPSGRVIIWTAGALGQPPRAGQSVRLHVRVPRGVDLDLTTRAGRIVVSGEVRHVLASATDRIEVHGAIGDLTLVTLAGGIVADGGNGQRIDTRSQNGDVTIFSTDARVTAVITGTGGVEFVGTLAGRDNSFLTATGPITVALPEDVPYSFLATAPGGRLLTDFRPNRASANSVRPVCGMVFSGQAYDYRVRYLDDIYSHLDVAFANVGSYVSGTLSADAYYFFTDRSDVTFHTPFPQAIHILAENRRSSADVDRPGQPLGVSECSTPLPETDVRFTARTNSGLIYIHHILMRRQ